MAKNDDFQPNFILQAKLAEALYEETVRAKARLKMTVPDTLGGIAMHLLITGKAIGLPTQALHELLDIIDQTVMVLNAERIVQAMPPRARAAAAKLSKAMETGAAGDMQEALVELAALLGEQAKAEKDAETKTTAAVDELVRRAAESLANDPNGKDS